MDKKIKNLKIKRVRRFPSTIRLIDDLAVFIDDG